MRIVYASCLISDKKIEKLFNSKSYAGFQVQKFHKLLSQGFASNGCDVQIVSSLPVTRNNCKKKYLKSEVEDNKGIIYNYLVTINIPVIKNIFTILVSTIKTLNLIKKSENCEIFIVADCLNQAVSIGALIASKITRTPSIGIVTDLPDFLSDKGKDNFKNVIIKQFDNYILLTEQMNDYIVNNITHRTKPFIVIEGSVDINILNEKVCKKYQNKVCMYTGTLARMYGIENLVKGFIKANISGSELHIYGIGDYEDELKKLCKTNNNVKYYGIKANSYVVEEQRKATLLINPRPSHEEFTKYSFPSKNLEYLASGTPLLATDLPGIPNEYVKYEFVIKDESIEGMEKVLKNVLNLPNSVLEKKGMEAQKYVLENKNNVIQTKKIINWIYKII